MLSCNFIGWAPSQSPSAPCPWCGEPHVDQSGGVDVIGQLFRHLVPLLKLTCHLVRGKPFHQNLNCLMWPWFVRYLPLSSIFKITIFPAALHWTALDGTALHCTALPCTALCRILPLFKAVFTELAPRLIKSISRNVQREILFNFLRLITTILGQNIWLQPKIL